MPIEPLTKKELVKYFSVYRGAFPDWDVEHRVMLTRSSDPISQHIAFQALRSGAYRPSCSVHVTGPPGGSQLLFQFLDVKHQDVTRREHETMWPRVIEAMEEQFVPPVRKPLDVAEVLRLGEAEVERDGIENLDYFNGLGTLSVHLGDTDRALQWCDRAESCLGKTGLPPAEWELQHAEFARQLRDAIREGHGREFLAEAGDQSGG